MDDDKGKKGCKGCLIRFCKWFFAFLCVLWITLFLREEIPSWKSMANGEFRFENYYSSLTGWRAGSKEAAEEQITKDLLERFPVGTPAMDLVNFVVSFDDSFRWYDNPETYSDGSTFLGGGKKNKRWNGIVRCFKKDKEGKYEISYMSGEQDSLFLFPFWTSYTFVMSLQYDDENRIVVFRTLIVPVIF